MCGCGNLEYVGSTAREARAAKVALSRYGLSLAAILTKKLSRHSPGDRCGAPTSSSSGHRILVSDLLHRPARKGNSIDSLRETAIIDQLLAPIAEQLRRVRNRILY